MTKVLVPLAPGFEEMEAVTIIDVLRRGGVEVTTASPDAGPVTASRGVVIVADAVLEEVLLPDSFDMVVIPGGMGGTQALMSNEPFLDFLRCMNKSGRLIGAICAAPMILGRVGILDGTRYTAYPGVIEEGTIPEAVNTGRAVESNNLIVTSRGPGTAVDFALAVLERLVGRDVRLTVENQLVRD